jgi:hypothetical protein
VLVPAAKPETAKPNPQNPIAGPEVGMWVGAQRDLELVAEDQVFEREMAAGSNGSHDSPDNEQQEFEHLPE